ncbi:MAG TPA: DUF1344 domain-containing protein [archaeon]|nr:DUF1344 domain-containing protein [archaeon]
MQWAWLIPAILLVVGSPAWAQMAPPLPMPLNPVVEPPPAKPTEPPAMAVQGKITSLDQWSKTMTLEDGTMLRIPDSIAMTALKEGVRVIATYEEQDGQKVATSVIRVRPSSNS